LSDKKDLALRGHGQNSQLVFLMADLKNLTGRPASKEGKRSEKITARFSEEEYKQVIDLGKTLGLSKTDLVRARVLNDAKRVVVNAGELIRCLDAIGAEMGRAGNNINQLARHANFLKLHSALNPSVVSRYNDLLEGYITMQQALENALRKIIREMSD